MPTEPDNNIEEQLKNWAAKWRDEAGSAFELHPVTRRLLQDEVVRTFPQTPEGSEKKAGWLALLRPRLAFALSVVAVMAIVGVAVLPSLSKAKSKGQATFAATGKREIGVNQVEELRRVGPDQAGKSIQVGRLEEKNVAVQEPPAAGLAVNTPTPSSQSTLASSRSDRFGEGTKSTDARDKAAPASAAPVSGQKGSEPARLASREKVKESRLAKDEKDVARRAATDGNELNREIAEGKPALKTANAGDVAGVDAKPVALARALAVEQPTAAIPATLTDNSKRTDRDLAAAAVPTQRDRPASPALTPAAEVPPGAAGGNATFALNYQKAQSTGAVQSLDSAVRTDQVQLANASGLLDQMAGNATQRFSQAARYRLNFNSPPMPNVLNSFQLEQTGRQLRIVDSDGSVYEGAFTAPEQVSEAVTAKIGADDAESKKNVALRYYNTPERGLNADAATATDQASSFRVAGTNRTLNQMVVFTGNVLAIKNSISAGVAGTSQQYNAQSLRQTVEASQAASNTSQQTGPRVQGQVIVGGGDRIEINATPAGP